ncbi:hypothetical protein Cni_G12522 [Canna indica]|uniref:PHD-type zinc finger plants domain-containing protein n=1 Tax=Canna indica TaxID=4628 RepID=A0AAQ3K7Z2_9LILI|nr:hypothetical protein Cni_G12522 [Canna indica]
MDSKAADVPPRPPVVCCMCGDRGLTKELFRCKICLDRSQHKYCSDLYPKAESYSACNWCLREKGGAKSLPKESIKDSNASVSPSSSSHGNDHTSNGAEVKLHRSVFPSQPNKPIKRPKLLDRSASDVTDRIRSDELSPRLGRARQVVRGKVRRYKLLEEFST